jgi:hypothetical protein
VVDLRLGDCLDVMRTLPEGSVDAVVTDPPAGISFMGKEWDSNRGHRDRWVPWLAERMAEARRVAKPGAYALVWAIPRTSHWTALALEDAGWTIRDRISHLFGQGFPKAKSCLKPACEDWWLAWNPAKRVTPLNIDACRIGTEAITVRVCEQRFKGSHYSNGKEYRPKFVGEYQVSGRWPANVTHDGSDEVMEAFAAFGEKPTGRLEPHHQLKASPNRAMSGPNQERMPRHSFGGDSGSAARFFYCAKASRADRGADNAHPTVKPQSLMRWLCRLITPDGGTILDPYMGSGSTGVAAVELGHNFIGIESYAPYFEMARRRIEAASAAREVSVA